MRVMFGVDKTIFSGVFYSTPYALHQKYYQESMPDETVLTIAWAVVYIWIFAAVTYILTSMFLEDRKSPVHVQPTLMSGVRCSLMF